MKFICKKNKTIFGLVSKEGYYPNGFQVDIGQEDTQLDDIVLSENDHTFRCRIHHKPREVGGRAWVIGQYPNPNGPIAGYVDLTNWMDLFPIYDLVQNKPTSFPLDQGPLGVPPITLYSDPELTTKKGSIEVGRDSRYLIIPENAQEDGSIYVSEPTIVNWDTLPFTIRTTGRDYDFTINFGDGTSRTILKDEELPQSTITHEYPAGEADYEISITSPQNKQPQVIPPSSVDMVEGEILTPFLQIDIISTSEYFPNCIGESTTTLPYGWLMNNTNITTFSLRAGFDKKLLGIPMDLLYYTPNITKSYQGIDHLNSVTKIPPRLFDKLADLNTLSNLFLYSSSIITVPPHLFRYNKKLVYMAYMFEYADSLKINPNIFCDEATEKTTRFKNVPMGDATEINFNRCFYRDTYTESAKGGTAPALWEYTFTNENGEEVTVVKDYCFSGNNIETLTNWLDIPEEWGGPREITFTINPTPSDAIVKINGAVQNDVPVTSGTYISYEVSKEGYESKSESQYVVGSSSSIHTNGKQTLYVRLTALPSATAPTLPTQTFWRWYNAESPSTNAMMTVVENPTAADYIYTSNAVTTNTDPFGCNDADGTSDETISNTGSTIDGNVITRSGTQFIRDSSAEYTKCSMYMDESNMRAYISTDSSETLYKYDTVTGELTNTNINKGTSGYTLMNGYWMQTSVIENASPATSVIEPNFNNQNLYFWGNSSVTSISAYTFTETPTNQDYVVIDSSSTLPTDPLYTNPGGSMGTLDENMLNASSTSIDIPQIQASLTRDSSRDRLNNRFDTELTAWVVNN